MNKKALSRGDKAIDDESGENRGEKEEILTRTTEGVSILLGDPRKAIVKLSIPVIVALSV
ncbi:MAG: hypothetical protein ACOX79_03795 [Methanosarcina sp.]|jgi:hypothetical protein